MAGGKTDSPKDGQHTGGIVAISGGQTSSMYGGHVYVATGVNSQNTGGFMSLFTYV